MSERRQQKLPSRRTGGVDTRRYLGSPSILATVLAKLGYCTYVGSSNWRFHCAGLGGIISGYRSHSIGRRMLEWKGARGRGGGKKWCDHYHQTEFFRSASRLRVFAAIH